MKNTAPRVGAPRGAGGRAVRPPREAQGRKPRARQPAGRGAPCRIKKCRLPAGIRAGGQGGKPRKPAREGKLPAPLRAKQRASRKKPPEGHRCADRRESPKGACLMARRSPPAQEPDKGNRPTRAELPTQPNGRLCYARLRRGLRMHRSKTNEKRTSQQ